MSMELYLIHVGFIAALVFSVYRSGMRQGEKKLLNRLMNDAIDIVDTKNTKTPL